MFFNILGWGSMRDGDTEFSSNVNKTTTTTKIIFVAKVDNFKAPVK